jgi:hypothetical protein
MSETGTRGLTPVEAARTLQEIAGFEQGLRQRSEGLSWMVLGLMFAGLMATFGWANAAFAGRWPWWANYLLWVPWVAAGTAVVWSVWRSAALAVPGLRKGRPVGAHVVAWVGFSLAGIYALAFLAPPMAPPFRMLMVFGLLALVFGASNLLRYSPGSRRVAASIGAVSLLAGVGGALVVADYATAAAASTLVLAASFLLGGAYLVTKR